MFGKLVLILGKGSSVGSIILLTSWLDRAADLRCACPRLPVCPGTGSALLLLGSGTGSAVALVGLVLSAFDTPNLESPPTNSLPPLLCPRRGVVCGGASPAESSGDNSWRPVVFAALNEKLGRADVVLLCELVLAG